jgi:hypothetical protein
MRRLRGTALAAIVALASGCEEKKSPRGGDAAAPPAASSAAPATASAVAPASVSAAPGPAPDAVAAQHVLVAYKGAAGAPKAVTRSKAEAKKRAEEVAAKAKAGADFAALVAEYSDDATSKDRLGSVGKFTRDKMVKPFSDAAFGLKVGEVSDPVETQHGFHVIKRNQ